VLRAVYVGEEIDGREVPLPLRKAIRVGRNPGDGGVTLKDRRASRLHATFTWDGEKVTVVDGSSHGSERNGVRFESATLEPGDVVRMGDSLVVLMPSITEREARDHEIPELLGRSPSMRQLRADVAMVAPEDARVLVLGETGTGKELVAQAVHRLSGRKGPFVPVNCAAIPEQLAESQFFGHVAGAFTGARKDEPGYFRAADGGTIFLDELGELPGPLQAKLLRTLEDGAVTPVGATAPVKCDVRVVAATNRDLTGDGFREDLYARLAEIVLRTPPLGGRREDVLEILAAQLDDGARIEPALAEALLLHPWPHNVRELVKVAKELRIRGKGQPLLELVLVEERLTRPEPEAQPSARPSSAPEEVTEDHFREVCAKHGGNVSRIAKELGRSRRQIYRYVEQWSVDLEALRD